VSTITVEDQIKVIKNKFPFNYNGIILNLLNEDILVEQKSSGGRNYIMHVIDNEGYKYKIRYSNLNNCNTCKTLTRYFYNNPYTYDNIDNYCKLNNIDMRLSSHDFPIIGYSREKLDFVDFDGKIHKISWNQIQHYTFQYQTGYEKIKEKRKKDRELSKQDVIDIVMKMQEQKDSPLDIYDFYPKQKDGVGIRIIRKYWGELWLMQKELGMKITGKHGSILSDEDTLKEIELICNKVKDTENRTLITHKDFRKYGTYSDDRRYAEVCKKLKNLTFREYIMSLGYELQKAGSGMNYKFDDGEVTTSLYEYEFSNFLRQNGFAYGVSYFRNIYYKKLDSEYRGNMNCDYQINFNDKSVYIELAGILGNKEHQDAYRNNTPLNSKSKEEYRQKLNQKRKIFERNNLEYYILLPDEMNERTYKSIFSKYTKVA
jgi:hypothetical protein